MLRCQHLKREKREELSRENEELKWKILSGWFASSMKYLGGKSPVFHPPKCFTPHNKPRIFANKLFLRLSCCARDCAPTASLPCRGVYGSISVALILLTLRVSINNFPRSPSAHSSFRLLTFSCANSLRLSNALFLFFCDFLHNFKLWHDVRHADHSQVCRRTRKWASTRNPRRRLRIMGTTTTSTECWLKWRLRTLSFLLTSLLQKPRLWILL